MEIESLQVALADAHAQRDAAQHALQNAQASLLQCNGAIIALTQLLAQEQAATAPVEPAPVAPAPAE